MSVAESAPCMLGKATLTAKVSRPLIIPAGRMPNATAIRPLGESSTSTSDVLIDERAAVGSRGLPFLTALTAAGATQSAHFFRLSEATAGRAVAVAS